MLTLWFDYGHIPDVHDAVTEDLKTVEIDTWLQVWHLSFSLPPSLPPSLFLSLSLLLSQLLSFSSFSISLHVVYLSLKCSLDILFYIPPKLFAKLTCVNLKSTLVLTLWSGDPSADSQD